ncbi:hypothetical protein PAF17_15905 [Paracoccus sp. Z330]|uniref:Peptidase S24/S26A/S26B/S26C domain-containing protein n=1 Tax=Paracoccus onchidii TaxID=3017813 RepID=A0ABT4ZHZ0_9RHOB|nr:LexA family transcriptional regulator [Paracoccus onchidii]MDB6178976.1 hypothetical protein [Paracoccus onchidii]
MTDWAIDYVRDVLLKHRISATELAARAGVSSTTLTRPLNAKGDHPYSISRRTLEKIREVSGIPFPGDTTVVQMVGEDQILIRSIDAHAGRIYADGDPSTTKEAAVSFSPSLLSQITDSPAEMLVIVPVVGDSMKPTLLEGDQVLVDQGQKNLDFDGLFAIRYNTAIHIKRIGRGGVPGQVNVRSDNTEYSAVNSAASDLDVLGRVLWIGRKV